MSKFVPPFPRPDLAIQKTRRTAKSSRITFVAPNSAAHDFQRIHFVVTACCKAQFEHLKAPPKKNAEVHKKCQDWISLVIRKVSKSKIFQIETFRFVDFELQPYPGEVGFTKRQTSNALRTGPNFRDQDASNWKNQFLLSFLFVYLLAAATTRGFSWKRFWTPGLVRFTWLFG